MEFFEFIVDVLAATPWDLIITVIRIAMVTMQLLSQWFRKNLTLANNPNNLALSIETKLKNGKAVIFQGFFNEKDKDIVKGQVIEYQSLDSEVRNAHRDGKVVIYQM